MDVRRFGSAQGADLSGDPWLRECLRAIRARDRSVPGTGSTWSAAIEAAPGTIVGEVTLKNAKRTKKIDREERSKGHSDNGFILVRATERVSIVASWFSSRSWRASR